MSEHADRLWATLRFLSRWPALAAVCAVIALPIQALAESPRTLYWDAAHLANIRSSPENRNKSVQHALEQLTKEANQALRRGPYSVVDKSLLPPSGDKHDYLSFSRYWWPNPETPDGLPYVRRDGHVNMALLVQGDRVRIGAFYDDVESLALAAYLVDGEEFAPHAMRLVRTWFINPKTRMNPNLNFGQGVPGRTNGRGVGIMDTRHFIRVLEAVALLDDIGAVTDTDRAGLQEWFTDYLDWMLTSKLGNEERQAENNHGSWYAAQAAYIALFLKKHEFARDIIGEVRSVRIADGIQSDGSQPAELVRTRSLHYSLFNLSALFVVARLGEHVDVDLWNYEAETGASLVRGLDFLVPYLRHPSEWPYPEMDDFAISDRDAQLLYLARARFNDDKYLEPLGQGRHRSEDRRYSALLFADGVSQTTTPAGDGQKHSVTTTPSFEPVLLAIARPDMSRYTEDEVRRIVPTTGEGRATIVAASDITLLDEAFRGDRGRDLRRRQAMESARAIVVETGVLSLDQVVDQLSDARFAENDQGVVTIRLPLVVAPDATLIVEGKRTSTLRLSTDRGAFLANAGRLFIVDALVTSWSEAPAKPTTFVTKTEFRPFISSYVRSETYLAKSTIQHLGFAAPTAYGLSLTSHPDRNRGQPSEDWPTGIIVANEFRGLYYGFYSFEARDVAIVGNRYIDSVVYGIDPHDRSTRLVIARNTTTGTIERHGIIGSRGVSDSFIIDNATYRNAGSGIMLDRQCANNVVQGNQVYQNGQGIAIYESPANIVCDNLIAFNDKSGVRVRNSIDIEVRRNTIVGHGGFALEVYAKTLDDHKKRTARGDAYDTYVDVSFYHNCVNGNRGLAKARNLGTLRLSNVRQDADLPTIAAKLNVPFHTPRSGDDTAFGHELKPLASQLRRVFDEEELMFEVRRHAP